MAFAAIEGERVPDPLRSGPLTRLARLSAAGDTSVSCPAVAQEALDLGDELVGSAGVERRGVRTLILVVIVEVDSPRRRSATRGG